MNTSEPSLMRPPRDTGLMLEGRAARERRRRKRARQRALLTVALVVSAALAVGWFISRTAPRAATRTAVASGARGLHERGPCR